MPRTLRSPGQIALVGSLISARKSSGLTQDELSQRLHCHQSMIARIESGQRRVDVIELVVMCRAIGIPTADLISSIVSAVGDDHPFI